MSAAPSRAASRWIGPAAPAEALADPLAVKRIITNLLSNALLYTQEGGGVPVSVREEEGAVVVAVKDNGHGFYARRSGGGRNSVPPR